MISRSLRLLPWGAQDDSTISFALAAYRLALDHFMEDAMRATLEVSALIAAFFLATWPFPAPAQTAPSPEQQQPAFTSGELVGTGPLVKVLPNLETEIIKRSDRGFVRKRSSHPTVSGPLTRLR
jgi:hypothetical protein